jgi:hypothetical protein
MWDCDLEAYNMSLVLPPLLLFTFIIHIQEQSEDQDSAAICWHNRKTYRKVNKDAIW